MNILNKLAIKNLKLNKKRSIVTTIGIILAVALICAASNMFTSVQQTLVDVTTNQGGYYHLKLMDLDSGDVKKLSSNRDIKALNLIYDVGFSDLEGSNNLKKPYLHLYSIYDKDTFSNMSYKLKEGRLPENSGEVVINTWIIENAEVPYKIGDVLSLEIGTRMYKTGQNVLSKNDYSSGEEELVNKFNKKVTVVGIMEKPGKELERTNEAGYTIITMNEDYDNLDAYLSLKNPYQYQRTFKEILGADYRNNQLANYKYMKNSELLRWEVFSVNDTVYRMLMSLVIFGVSIICFTSIFCIRNSFAISMTEKIKMYGVLASVGATKKQIKKSVLFEAFLLGFIGIPIGVLAGIVVDHFLIKICNVLLPPGTIQSGELVLKISWIPVVVSVLLGFITIYFSAISSAIRASKINPIESIRGNKEVKIKAKRLKAPKLINKLFGIGGVIAYKNLKRSKRKYRTTVFSIISSIFVFITMSAFLRYGFGISDEYYIRADYNMIVSKDSEDKESLENVLKLSSITDYTMIYEGIDDGRSQIHLNDTSKLNGDFIDSDAKITVVATNSKAYKKYVEKLGLNYEKVKTQGVLCDDYGYSTVEGKKVITRYYKYKDGDIINGKYANEDISVKISKVTDERLSGFENIYITGGYLFVDVDNFDLIKFGEDELLINSTEPDKLEKEITKEFKTFTVSNLEQMAKYQRGVSLVLAIFMYGFISVITLIGITNIFNTITANMSLRQKEFATLKSIGMTEKEFNKMINLETIFYSTKSLIFGIILGILGSVWVYKMFSAGFDSGYHFPAKPIILSIIFVFVIIFSIMRYSIKNINKQNIIETIRSENI